MKKLFILLFCIINIHAMDSSLSPIKGINSKNVIKIANRAISAICINESMNAYKSAYKFYVKAEKNYKKLPKNFWQNPCHYPRHRKAAKAGNECVKSMNLCAYITLGSLAGFFISELCYLSLK